jgi:hypothetical protein
VAATLGVLVAVAASAAVYASGGKPSIVGLSAARITAHSAKIKARINPEGSATQYEIWFWRGCSGGFCERAPPHVVATGEMAAGGSYHAVSVKLNGLQAGEPNNGYWVVASNSSGTTETSHQEFATPK